ncbi:helix-turn-helix domain-containing protein [Micromonospora sp. WMMD710]|uniref:helix-turn-helix domain-containing protein n=2 Tax=Micromonospora sp. WMMD710 TaxID=3016085 RepID=UPI002416AE35|nr:helix-turn-helix domain-containing protein [Micromonospora sp. WMMD710]MDG4762408.1 helix-turn-helix domain-containing protein [Micromonospora sp. WMMD710]MDG4762454.1 helix-turn-helix domain-containing protein [Micromonospora sp. WMMD710]MDG4762489.1 helix-turn-helix domain-containing protein [Micromonospora sp. WMMD710]
MSDNAAGTATPMRELVAEEIRVLLARQRISASKLARTLGMTQSYLARRMSGDTAFDVDDLARIANVLGVTVVDLLPSAKVRPNNRSADSPVRATSPTRTEPSRPKSRPSRNSIRPVSPVPPTRRRPSPIHRPAGR